MGTLGIEVGDALSRVKKLAGISPVQVRDCGVGGSKVHLLGSVPNQRLVRPHLVVIDAEILGSLGEHDGVVDFLDVEPLVLQRPEPTFT